MFNIETRKKGNLRIGQFPDPHLGAKFKDFNKINPQTGNNYMWDEQIRVLNICTDMLIEQDIAVAILPGDIYDKKSGISDKLQAALRECILKFLDNDIAVVLITGNHDFPKSREYKALISCFDGYDRYMNVVPIWKAQYDSIAINDEILIHAIPQCFTEEQYREEVLKVKRNDSFKTNIFTTHTGVQGTTVEDFLLDTGWLNVSSIDSIDVDYIALGHYHKPYKVSPKAAYAGVMVKTTFSDKDSRHGVLVFDGETNEITFHSYETKGMEEYSINCLEKESSEINEELKTILENFNRDSYIKIIFDNIEKFKQKQIDYNTMHSIKKEAFYCKLEYNYSASEEESENGVEVESSVIKPLREEFQDKLKSLVANETDYERIQKLYDTTIYIEEK